MKRVLIVASLLLLVSIAISLVFFSTVDLNDFGDPLLNASRDGDTSAISKLLAHGTSPNATDGYGNTPLSIAAHFGQTDAIDLLLKNGAAIDGIDGKMTPLQCAVYSKRPEAAAFLLQQDANPNLADEYGATPLTVAAANGDTNLVKLLLDAGASIEQADKLGWRPLHVALRSTTPTDSERLATVRTLLEYGADPNADNAGGYEKDGEHDSHVGYRTTLPNQGNKPIAIAQSNGFSRIVELIEAHGGTLSHAKK